MRGERDLELLRRHRRQLHPPGRSRPLLGRDPRRRRFPESESPEPVSAGEHLGQYIERGAERINAQGTFGLRTNGSYSVAAEICDISTLGLKGSCGETLSIGSLVSIDIPGIGPAEAEVKWQLAGQFGAMFLEPIDLHNCEWSAVKARFS